MDESTNGRYDMILGRDLLAKLVLDLKFSENIIVGGKGSCEGCSAPIADIINCYFLCITDKTVKPEESFLDMYVDKCPVSDSAISSTLWVRRILDDNYENSNLNKVMDEQFQHLNAI